MAFYNPQRVVFNPDTSSLWKLLFCNIGIKNTRVFIGV